MPVQHGNSKPITEQLVPGELFQHSGKLGVALARLLQSLRRGHLHDPVPTQPG